MKPYMKHISLIAWIAIIAAMAACKKDNTQTTQTQNPVHLDSLAHGGPDFRDTLVGSYNCVKHIALTYCDPNQTGYDSVIGPSIITVSRSTASDSALIINGTIFYLWHYNNGNIAQPIFWTDNDPITTTYFVLQNDSIWTESIIYHTVCEQNFYYWTGH